MDKKAILNVSFYVFLISVVLGILSFFIDNNFLLAFRGVMFFCVGLISFIVLERFYYKTSSETQDEINNKIKYIFLLFLLLLTLSSLNFSFLKPIIEFLRPLQMRLTIFTILFGFITFYLNREVMEEVEKEKTNEEQEEKKRKSEFPKVHPKMNSFPILRHLLRWMYKEGWWYSSLVVVLIFAGFSIRVYHLGTLSLWWDEIITGRIVSRIVETGLPLEPSGLLYYWRGIAYHYFVSFFVIVFGHTEFWLRFPSVLFGMGIVIFSFLFAKKINKKVGLLVLLFLVFSTYNIEYSRFARFYIMNAFLLVLSISVFYKGFFEDKLKYKFLSAILFFIMMQTVQAGAIFLSLVGAWGLFLAKGFFIHQKGRLTFLKNKTIDFVFVFIFLIIFYLGNIFYKLIKIKVPYETAINLGLANKPTVWTYFIWPKWRLFNFFSENYIPLILILLSLIVLSFLFVSNNKRKQSKFFTFIGASTFIGIVLYEIGCRNVYGARMYLFSEALIVLTVFISCYYFFKILFKNQRIIIFSLFVLTLLLMLNIRPYFYERISIQYGDDVSLDPFRTTKVAAYRADYKTTYEYLKKNIKDGDIWINVMGYDYFYYNHTPDYIFNQNYRWNTGSFYDGRNFLSPTSKSILINSPQNILNISHAGRKVWLLVNGGSINVLYTTHVRSDFIRFLNQNEDKVVYKSPDKFSEVLLFNN